jgi:integrase
MSKKGRSVSSRRRGHVAKKINSKGKAVYYPVVELPRQRVLDPATSQYVEKRRQQWHPGHPSKRAAERELTRILGDLDKGVYIAPSDLTLGAFLDRWLPAMAGNAEPNTLETWGHYARANIKPRIGHILLQQLTADDLRTFYAGLAVDGSRAGKGLEPKTIKNVHGLIHRALEDAVDQQLVPRNVSALRSARPAKVPRVERRVWTPEELRRFLDATATHRLGALWLLDCTTGLRRSELLGLPWRAVDLDKGEFAVLQRIIIVNSKPQIQPGTKTPKSARRIALDPITVAALKAHRARQGGDRLAWGPAWQDHDLVFCREDGTPLRPMYATRQFAKLAKEAGLPPLTLHGLRHSYATAALAAGEPLKVISERIGHANIAITSDLYQHVLPSMDRQTADAVAGLILGRGGSKSTG